MIKKNKISAIYVVLDIYQGMMEYVINVYLMSCVLVAVKSKLSNQILINKKETQKLKQ